ncbi:MAG: putative metal-binding motif-containing protein [Deltaproteobacteria bacterium]|nr:putative metal-binding motif-containing protein [Deltaproteobacteria bacterium]
MGRLGKVAIFWSLLSCSILLWVSACSDSKIIEGAFCESDEECSGSLVCEFNECVEPDPNACEPACVPQVETCFQGTCVVIADANDKDGDGSPQNEDCDDFDRTVYPGAIEACDGVDNDCDDQVDEDCPVCTDGESRNCGSDLGACAGGSQMCQAGTWTACTSQNPVPEACDGLDNDCDGRTDEICPCTDGDEQPCSVDEGICVAGIELCESGAWTGCLNGQLPADQELCNGHDDDCDGETDEDFPLGEACTAPGECGSGGLECADEETVRCSTAPGGSQDGSLAELCNQLDDDCDGDTDEDFAELGAVCDSDDTDECQNGTWTCATDGLSLVCENETVTDLAEECNGQDDDCDGETDEDFGIGELCQGTGGCGEGVIECAELDSVRCSTNPGGSHFEPGPEQCDNVDNDCDGLTDAADEDLVITSCELQQGVCASAMHSVDQCVSGAWQACTGTQYGADYGTEICDGLDNDCDSEVDAADSNLQQPLCENQNGVCAGAIKPVQLCVDGIWAECGAAAYQANSQHYSSEICDGRDNDCDGLTDAEDQDLVLTACESQEGVCAGDMHSAAQCVSGIWQACTSAEYGAGYGTETCDTLDNDCDGQVDAADFDLVVTDCERQQGVCADAVHSRDQCVSGSWQTCGLSQYGYPYGTETCDGQDNDCDGRTDGTDIALANRQNCSEQRGVCAGSKKSCPSGTWVACTDATYSAHSSEYINPDLTAAHCFDGATPKGTGEGMFEVDCDGLDNDCDGTTDDQISCDNDHWTDWTPEWAPLCHATPGLIYDCCDTDEWTFPGQTEYYADSRDGCLGYDYNCDGTETKEPALNTTFHCMVLSPSTCFVDSYGFVDGPPACGEAGNYATQCSADWTGCHPAFAWPITMKCR